MITIGGGAVASWLVRSTPDRVVGFRSWAGGIVLCSWARHFTPTVPLSTQVYKWVSANNAGGNPAMDAPTRFSRTVFARDSLSRLSRILEQA